MLFVNPFIPRSDQYFNSPYKFNTLSSILVMRIKKIIKGYCLDITPSSQDQPTKKCTVYGHQIGEFAFISWE